VRLGGSVAATMADEELRSPKPDRERSQPAFGVPQSPQHGSNSPRVADHQPHGFTGRLTARLSRMVSGLPVAQPANEYTSMQVSSFIPLPCRICNSTACPDTDTSWTAAIAGVGLALL
jgi:hypothetical protein